MIVPTLAVNPVILMLKNTDQETYHPIMYWQCPLPSETLEDSSRWKSKGHHTAGFKDRDEAVDGAMKLCQMNQNQLHSGKVYFNVDEDKDTLWDGSGIPADVAFFKLSELTEYVPES